MARGPMPKTLLVAVAMATGVLLAACGSGSGNLGNAADVTASTTASTSSTAASSTSSTSGATATTAVPATDTTAAASPSTSADAGSDASRVVLHENDVSFYFHCACTTPQPITFTWDGGYAITEGQPWQGVEVLASNDPQQLNLQVGAGRKKSAPVAQWFNDRVDGAVTHGEGGNPDSLNFAITGTLTLEGSSVPVVIGQGSALSSNFWWVGGKGFTVRPTEQGTAVVFTMPDGSEREIYGANNTNTTFGVR